MPNAGGLSFARPWCACLQHARESSPGLALLKLVVEELSPDDLFAELVGRLDRIPRRQWPSVIAIAVALRHSWRRDGLTRIAGRLRVSLATSPFPTAVRLFTVPNHHVADSPARLDPVKALQCAPTPRGGAHGLDGDSRSSPVRL
jgi:hypothetical protein